MIDKKEKFKDRLAELRVLKGVSAREMSLTLGQSDSYINAIENGRSYPSMDVFFEICKFLEIDPKDFFEYENKSPQKVAQLATALNNLSDEQLGHLLAIAQSMKKGNN